MSKKINPKRDVFSHIIIPTDSHSSYRIYLSQPTHEYKDKLKWSVFNESSTLKTLKVPQASNCLFLSTFQELKDTDMEATVYLNVMTFLVDTWEFCLQFKLNKYSTQMFSALTSCSGNRHITNFLP